MRAQIFCLAALVGCAAGNTPPPESPAAEGSSRPAAPSEAPSPPAVASGPVDAGPPTPGLPDPEEARRRALEELRRMGGTPVEPSDKNANGRLSPEVIQGVIRASFGVFSACYKSGLARDQNLQGVVQTRFVINADGSVTSSTAWSGTTMPDPKVVECIVTGFRTLKFPPPPKGTVTVVYPIKFGPEDSRG